MANAAELLHQVRKSHERPDTLAELSHYAKEGERVAFGYIDRTYGLKAPKRDDVLFYHGVENWHSKGVIGRTDKITEAMGLTPRERALAHVAAAFHDTVQVGDKTETSWGDPQKGLKAVTRKRFTGDNEAASAEFAREYMIKANTVAGHDVFTPEDRDTVTSAIMLTVPKGWNGKTVFHPEFGKAGLIAQAVQLADLGGSGMNGAKMALYEALTLFPEENLDFRADADRLIGASRRNPVNVSSDVLDMYKNRLISWIQRQQAFVLGRQERIRASKEEGGEIASLPDGVRERVGALFKDEYFAQSVKALQQLETTYTATPAGALPKELFAVIKNPPKLTW